MKKIVALIILSLALLLASCGGGGGEVSDSGQGGKNSASSESGGENVVTEPNYGIYKSLLESYKTAFLQYPNPNLTPYQTNIGTGENGDIYAIYNLAYAELIDLNDDGILELLLVRVYDNTGYETYEFDEGYDIQIFSLTSENELYHVGELPLVIEGEAGERAVFEKTVIDGVTYLLTSEFTYYFTPETRDYWTMSADNDLTTMMEFDAEWNEATEVYDMFFVDGIHASYDEYREEYEYWYSDVERYVIVGGTEWDVSAAKEVLDDTYEFLEDYQSVEGDFGNSAFFEGRFVINEYIPRYEAEAVVIDYFKSQILKDEDWIREVTEEGDAQLFIDSINDNRFIPGYIIHSAQQLEISEYGKETVYMVEDLAAELNIPDSTLNDLIDYEIVRIWVDEVHDFDVSTASPQIAFGTYRMWVIVGRTVDDPTYKVYEILSDKFYSYLPEYGDDPIHVLHLGSTFELGAAGENPFSDIATYTGADYYIHQDQYDYVSYQNFGGYENYLITSGWGISGEMDIYRNSIGDNGEDIRGELLYSLASGEILMLTCNESDLYSDIEVVFTSSSTNNEYSYYPFLSKMDGSLTYGDYADSFPVLYGTGF